ncbi:MAG: ankyrin repeat domain-containing protein, partial [Dermatophilaceae bacterium]|nr:ankyrin repeat domain-containing protein [Dermatophilaceae bacterium]
MTSTPAPAGAAVRKASPVEHARLDSDLRDAAWKNDVTRAKALVARGADVNAKDETQQSAYLVATSE